MEERDFESLRDLVNSDIQIDRNREESGKEPLVTDFAGLVTLKSKVDKYCSLLEIPEQDSSNFNYYNDCELKEDYEYD